MKTCVEIKRPDGSVYTVPIGARFMLNPGEFVAGKSISCDEVSIPKVKAVNLQEELSSELGTGFGNVLKQLAKPFAAAMGRQGCSSCEARRLITNAYAVLKAKHGQIEAVKIIKDLWMLSFKATGDEVLVQLKAKLND